MYANKPTQGMSYEEFADAYRFADPNVAQEDIDYLFDSADKDESNRISKGEFVKMLLEEENSEGEHIVEDEMTAEEYWDKFSSKG